MSGLLERIVRRRRASASSRLGPPSENGSPYGQSYANGGPSQPPRPLVDRSASLNGAQQVVETAWNPATPDAGPRDSAEVDAPAPVDQGNGAEAYAPAPQPPAPDSDITQEFNLIAVDPGAAPDESPALDEPAPIATLNGQAAAPEPAPEAVTPGPADPELTTEPVTPGPADPELTPEPAAPPEPAFRERGRMRRRARYLRRLREVQLRDIGGFMVELNRFQTERPELVEAKVEGAAHTDLELRGLESALGEQQTLRELREAGIGGACEQCGAVHGSEDRFCASCGEPLSRNALGEK